MSDRATRHINVLILGAGPAGYTAAIYAARSNLSPLVVAGPEPGGQLTTTTDVENYPGYPKGISGPEMMEELREQAERFGTEVVYDVAVKVDLSRRPFKVTTEETDFTCNALIIATGATARYLGIESEQRLRNKGVSACATCDGAFYRDQDVAVVGGGDTAMEEAQYLTRMCKSVHLVHRRDAFRASQIMQQRTLDNPKIKVHWNSVVDEVLGDDAVVGMRLRNTQDDAVQVVDVTGFFLAIGHVPNSSIFKGQLDMDDVGYLKLNAGSTSTNIEGVFACGDVADKIYRQAVTAAGTGCMAAIDSERWLAEQDS
ncbi:MAG: thioredoxin-disulfide reductase [Nannocystaceae bacterium]